MTKRFHCKLWADAARINPFFKSLQFLRGVVAALVVVLAPGCKTKDTAEKPAKPEKVASTLRLHLEENDIGLGVGSVQVFRSKPMKLTVQKTHFVDEGEITKATVVDSQYGGHLIQIEYTRRGKMELQMATASHPGRRVAVWSRWTEGRWLAAPVVQKGIEDGVFAFTPDCSREEAERIVRGLNNVAIKLGNQEKPKKPKKEGKEKKTKPTEEQEMFK